MNRTLYDLKLSSGRIVQALGEDAIRAARSYENWNRDQTVIGWRMACTCNEGREFFKF